MNLKKWEKTIGILIILVILAAAPVFAAAENKTSSGQKIGFTGETEFSIQAGEKKEASFGLTNAAEISDTFELSVISGPEWAVFSESAVDAGVEETVSVKLVLNPPADESGDFKVTVKIASVEDPKVFVKYDLSVKVNPAAQKKTSAAPVSKPNTSNSNATAVKMGASPLPEPRASPEPAPSKKQVSEEAITEQGAYLSGTAVGVAAGTKKTVNLNLENKGKSSGTFKVSIINQPKWAKLSAGTFELEAGETQPVSLELNPQAGVSGEFQVRLKAESLDKPEIFSTYDLAVKVSAPETSPTGYAILVNPNAAAAVVGAGVFLAFIFAYWHRTTVSGRKPEGGIPAITSEVRQIVSEVYKQEPQDTSYKLTSPLSYNQVYSKLVPYEKVQGKRLWEV